MSDTEHDDSEQDSPGISWAWDFAQPLEERGHSMLVAQRAAEDDKENEPGTTLFVASTDDEDRAMDVVKQDWLLADFKGNPVILDNHNHMKVVGRGISAKVPRVGDDAGKLMIRVRWDLDNPDPGVRGVGHQHTNGFRSAGSVGFRWGKKTARNKLDPSNPYFRQPVEMETWWGGTIEMSGSLYERNVLLEFSSATVPMNPKALQRSLLAELGVHDPGDIDARLKVVAETVPKAVALDLAKAAEDPEQRASLMTLLWPDLLVQLRVALPDEVLTTLRTDAAGRVVRAHAEAAPVPVPIPKPPRKLRGDGLDHLFPVE